MSMLATRPRAALFLAAAVPSLVGCASGPAAPEPQLLEGYGGYHRPVEGVTDEVQVWLDQGLQLVYGFNHEEGIRSFARAAELVAGVRHGLVGRGLRQWRGREQHGGHRRAEARQRRTRRPSGPWP